MRSLHYLPTTETKENYWRNGPHTDISVLTLLFQREGEAGLEILPGRQAVGEYGMSEQDKWSAVPAKQGPIVCNIGDMMSKLSLRLSLFSEELLGLMHTRRLSVLV